MNKTYSMLYPKSFVTFRMFSSETIGTKIISNIPTYRYCEIILVTIYL